MIRWILYNVAVFLAVAFLFVAVCWQTYHLYEWSVALAEAHGNGTVSGLLRAHAYTYMTHIFGDSLGWTVGGVSNA